MHEVFLQRIAAHPVFRHDTNFRIFLQYENDVRNISILRKKSLRLTIRPDLDLFLDFSNFSKFLFSSYPSAARTVRRRWSRSGNDSLNPLMKYCFLDRFGIFLLTFFRVWAELKKITMNYRQIFWQIDLRFQIAVNRMKRSSVHFREVKRRHVLLSLS